MITEYFQRVKANKFKALIKGGKHQKAIDSLKKLINRDEMELLLMLSDEDLTNFINGLIELKNKHDIGFISKVFTRHRVYNTPSGELTEMSEKYLKMIFDNVSDKIFDYLLYSHSVIPYEAYLLKDIKSDFNIYKSYYDGVGRSQINVYDSRVGPTEEIMLRIKKDFIDVGRLHSYWDSFINPEQTHDLCTKTINLDEFKSIINSDISWNDSIISYIKLDIPNILKYVCKYHKTHKGSKL